MTEGTAPPADEPLSALLTGTEPSRPAFIVPEDGQVLTITYDKLLEIYFQNPQFGYYFLVLTSQRLLENIARLDAIVAQHKAAAQQAAVVAGT